MCDFILSLLFYARSTRCLTGSVLCLNQRKEAQWLALGNIASHHDLILCPPPPTNRMLFLFLEQSQSDIHSFILGVAATSIMSYARWWIRSHTRLPTTP
jgi:hypothetical protein